MPLNTSTPFSIEPEITPERVRIVVWLICNVIGDHEPLLFDPVNWWTGTLLAAIAIDLGRQHASKTF